ncbi:response regulator [Candidatus Nitronereus thalassa]|uniref:Response regulator n=1 Tax=Candidatus Nitronereus thalassa TaxID=3020898 RepID=A0ABU3K8V0_9BACT|nr:response regulator [Candidatus Nitronereus thalassa]MDT7042787.1 response regulator [Candidatus Nitronereus thalassa]
MVLIITQNEKFGRYLKKWLDYKRFRCTLVCDGEEGLQHAQRDVPCVVVLDLYVKEPSGMDILHRLREDGYAGKIILMGGISVSPMISEALRLGVDQVIGGESNLGPLECAIQSACQPESTRSLSGMIDTQEQPARSF